MSEIVINNLTVESVQSFLKDWTCPERLAKEIVDDKKHFRKCGTFQNGNQLATIHRHGSFFAVLTPTGDVVKVFGIYEAEHVSYRAKHDCFIITGHETLTEVSSDGTIEEEFTR
jgi:hypothetical protein